MLVAPPFFQCVSCEAFLNSTWVEQLKGEFYVTRVLFQFMCTTPATRGSLHECSRTCVALACLVWYPLALEIYAPRQLYMHPSWFCLHCQAAPSRIHAHALDSTCPENTCSWVFLPREYKYMHILLILLAPENTCTLWHPDGLGLHVWLELPKPLWLRRSTPHIG